jgi:pimeloyl-ACP methyl ester carboxylesterase
MTQRRVRRVAVRDIEIEVEEAGSGDRAFVLVHGYTGSRDDFSEQLPHLAELGRTVAIDQRGHGGSTNTGDPDSYRVEELSADLAAALTALEIPACDLLGHSMGGMVALHFALTYPDRVRSLVLMDTVARSFRFVPPAILEGSLALIRSQGMAGLAAVMRKGNLPRPPAFQRCVAEMGEDRFWSRIEKKLEQMDPTAYEGLGAAQHDGVNDRLGEIDCPTLVIVGEQDVVFLGPADEIEAGIPNARRITISDAAHSPQLENPAAWLAAIREHLGRVRG